jgi:hypothetical protein
MTRITLALAGLLLLAGCGGMTIEDFEGTEPVFVPEQYFPGRTRVWGVFYDRSGSVRRQFTADVEGRLEDGVLVLDEAFQFKDGATDTRVWRLENLGDGRYEGTANDVIGTAEIRIEGQAINLNYDVDLEVGDETYQVHFDDWLILQEGDVVVNRATVTKFGFTVGELIAFFQKVEPPAAGAS